MSVWNCRHGRQLCHCAICAPEAEERMRSRAPMPDDAPATDSPAERERTLSLSADEQTHAAFVAKNALIGALEHKVAALEGLLDELRAASTFTWDDVRILHEAGSLALEGRPLDAKWAAYMDHFAARIAASVPEGET